MKALNNYITEKLHINNTTKIEYMYHPKNKDELIKYIREKIKKEGLGTKENPLDLNDIDTSKITDMSELFSNTIDGQLVELSRTGYFDISDWNVSNVKSMVSMFKNSNFNGDISGWDVSNVENMSWMFGESKFDDDISNWDVSNVKNMTCMFANSKFSGKNGSISDWNTKNVNYMEYMFFNSLFNDNVDNWNIDSIEYMHHAFENSPLDKNPPKWYKS